MNKLTQQFAALALILFAFGTHAFAQDGAGADAGAPPAPSTHKLYVGIFAGVNTYNTPIASNTTQFDYGGHASVDFSQLGNFSKLGAGFHFDNTNLRGNGGAGDRISYGTILGQVIFRDVANTGFYFAPEFGFAIVSFGIASVDAYTLGLEAGYDIPLCSHLSIAPEVHYDRNGPANLVVAGLPQSNTYKFLAALNYHFE